MQLNAHLRNEFSRGKREMRTGHNRHQMCTSLLSAAVLAAAAAGLAASSSSELSSSSDDSSSDDSLAAGCRMEQADRQSKAGG